MKTLSEIYNLSHDSSGFSSGLINWYNELMSKTHDDLTIADVSKMVRQDILKDVAISRAIEFFLIAPYDGEYSDGGLLAILASLNVSSLEILYADELKIALEDIKREYTEFDWFDDEEKNQYAKNVDVLMKKLNP